MPAEPARSPAQPSPPKRPGALSVSARFAGSQFLCKCLLSAEPSPRWLGRQKPGSKTDQTFTMGLSGGADLPLAIPHAPFLTLVESRGGRFVLRFDASWNGWVTSGQGQLTLAELLSCDTTERGAPGELSEYLIPRHCTITIALGDVEISIAPTLPTRKLAPAPSKLWAHPLRTHLALLCVFFLGALAAISQIPTSETYLEEQPAQERFILARSETLERAQVDYSSPSQEQQEVDTRKEDAWLSSPALAGPIELPPEIEAGTTEAAVYLAKRSGVASVFEGLRMKEIGEQIGRMHFDSSDENVESYGDLAPGDVNEATGAWGYGIREIGPGSGDGKEWGTVKTPGYKLATGMQRGEDYVAKALSRPHKSAAPPVSETVSAIQRSGLSYDVIRGQLGMRKRRLGQCFDLDENLDEERPSHITLTFDITPSGEVGDAEVLRVQSASVRTCVEDTLLSIHFPKPSDGRGVHIKDFSFRI